MSVSINLATSGVNCLANIHLSQLLLVTLRLLNVKDLYVYARCENT